MTHVELVKVDSLEVEEAALFRSSFGLFFWLVLRDSMWSQTGCAGVARG